MPLIYKLIINIVYFPIWWYTVGLYRVLTKLKNFIITREKSLAIFVWIKNIFKPMYGQYDWQGMLISFFMRIVQIFFRSIFLLFWLIFSLILLLAWIILPIIAILGIYNQIV